MKKIKGIINVILVIILIILISVICTQSITIKTQRNTILNLQADIRNFKEEQTTSENDTSQLREEKSELEEKLTEAENEVNEIKKQLVEEQNKVTASQVTNQSTDDTYISTKFPQDGNYYICTEDIKFYSNPECTIEINTPKFISNVIDDAEAGNGLSIHCLRSESGKIVYCSGTKGYPYLITEKEYNAR